MLDVFLTPVVFAEDLRIRHESDQSAVGRLCLLAALLFDDLAALKPGPHELPVSVGDDLEIRRKCVDCLGSDAVEADRELENIVVVLAAGVDLADAVDDLAQGDSTAEITDSDLRSVPSNLDLAADAHDEFVDRVVDDFGNLI